MFSKDENEKLKPYLKNAIQDNKLSEFIKEYPRFDNVIIMQYINLYCDEKQYEQNLPIIEKIVDKLCKTHGIGCAIESVQGKSPLFEALYNECYKTRKDVGQLYFSVIVGEVCRYNKIDFLRKSDLARRMEMNNVFICNIVNACVYTSEYEPRCSLQTFKDVVDYFGFLKYKETSIKLTKILMNEMNKQINNNINTRIIETLNILEKEPLNICKYMVYLLIDKYGIQEVLNMNAPLDVIYVFDNDALFMSVLQNRSSIDVHYYNDTLIEYIVLSFKNKKYELILSLLNEISIEEYACAMFQGCVKSGQINDNNTLLCIYRSKHVDLFKENFTKCLNLDNVACLLDNKYSCHLVGNKYAKQLRGYLTNYYKNIMLVINRKCQAHYTYDKNIVYLVCSFIGYSDILEILNTVEDFNNSIRNKVISKKANKQITYECKV